MNVMEWIHVDERTLEPPPFLSFSKTLGGNVVQKDERVQRQIVDETFQQGK